MHHVVPNLANQSCMQRMQREVTVTSKGKTVNADEAQPQQGDRPSLEAVGGEAAAAVEVVAVGAATAAVSSGAVRAVEQ